MSNATFPNTLGPGFQEFSTREEIAASSGAPIGDPPPTSEPHDPPPPPPEHDPYYPSPVDPPTPPSPKDPPLAPEPSGLNKH